MKNRIPRRRKAKVWNRFKSELLLTVTVNLRTPHGDQSAVPDAGATIMTPLLKAHALGITGHLPAGRCNTQQEGRNADTSRCH